MKPSSSSRAADAYRTSEYATGTTDFFSPGEQNDVMRELCTPGLSTENCFFWGGALGTERRIAVFLPEWYMPTDAPRHCMPTDGERTVFFASYLAEHPEILSEIPITALSVKGSGFRELTHRDYMGSVLSLGVNRSVIGDIAVLNGNEAVIFVADRIADYIIESLTKIGRDGVKVTRTDVEPTWTVPRRFEDVPLTVSSPRLDVIVKALTGQSREDSAEMIRNGLVELSYAVTDSVSADVKPGDIVSVRGYGKYLIGDVTGETKSGRLKIAAKKYM